MKYLLLIIGLYLFPLCNYAQNVASSNLKEEVLGRCTGSAYCSACRNCSRCAHCGSGGTCGVCAPSSSPSSDYLPHKTSNSKKKVGKTNGRIATSRKSSGPSSGAVASAGANVYLHVAAEKLNLRSGPGNSYPIIEKLKSAQRLLLINRSGKWAKVKVVSSSNIGYCSTAYVH